jgi:hypothetical protein
MYLIFCITPFEHHPRRVSHSISVYSDTRCSYKVGRNFIWASFHINEKLHEMVRIYLTSVKYVTISSMKTGDSHTLTILNLHTLYTQKLSMVIV